MCGLREARSNVLKNTTHLTDARSHDVDAERREQELDETGKPVVRESDWDDAEARAQGRLGTAVSKFEDGLAREKSRASDLDDLFDRASEKALGEDDDRVEDDESEA